MHSNLFNFHSPRAQDRRIGRAGTFLIAGCFALTLAACGPGGIENSIGAVKRVIGQAELEHNGVRTPLKTGDVLPQTGTIHTGADGVVVAVLKQGRAEVEIQKNSEFHLKKLAEKESELHLRKGNLWVRVNKISAREKFHVRTPTAIAGIRGTKFYTFHIQDFEGRDVHGTCHCEGEVSYGTHDESYEDVHTGDFVVLTREGKTILMTPEEMTSFMGDGATAHRHSALPDSPLGPEEQQMTPEQMRAFMELAERKFAKE
ncbi:MAG: FecR domain-containing protein [bacterium]|nr:FecR domain-containing protein [bacterium]